jgi:hypothetical protein
MLVVDALEGNLPLNPTCMIHAMSTGHAVIPGGMTSQLHILQNTSFNDHLKQLHSE